MDNTRPNLTAPDGTRLRIKLYSDDPGADEARQLVVDTLLAAGFVDSSAEPEDVATMRKRAKVRAARAALAAAEAEEAAE